MKPAPTIELIMHLSASEAVMSGYDKIEPEHLLMAVLKLSEVFANREVAGIKDGPLAQHIEEELPSIRQILSDNGVDATSLRRRLKIAIGYGNSPFKGKTMHRSSETRRIFDVAIQIASESKSENLNISHLLLATFRQPTARIAGLLPEKPESVLPLDSEFVEQLPPEGGLEMESLVSPGADKRLGRLSLKLMQLRDDLRAAIFGQDQAINAFVEGLFNAEVTAKVDRTRLRPKGVFVFAGPPGVGKTFLAETAAEALGKPFKRFDMSGFSEHQSGGSLVGYHKSYKDAHPGILTGFVQENPEAVLLFDEIEKAHLNVIHLFLQILDAGRLEDKFTETNVQFRDTIVIFTTNAGKALYEDSNSTGIYSASAAFHRKTILDALENEKDPRTGRPFFPQALCSRMAAGYPLMFNRLGVNELEKVAAAELARVTGLIETAYSKKIDLGPLVPLCLVLREGVHTDARTIKWQAEAFLKTELFSFSRLFKPERLDRIMNRAQRIIVDLDSVDSLPEDARNIVRSIEKPRVLLVADNDLADLWSSTVPEVEWKLASDEPDAGNMVSNEDFDLVLLDLLIGPGSGAETILASSPMTVYQFDNIPLAARGIAKGQEILRSVHSHQPELPCFLISFAESDRGGPALGDELLMTCVQSGGARGVIQTDFCSRTAAGWETARDDLAAKILHVTQTAHREKRARELGAEHKALSFETAPAVESDGTVRIRLRNLRLTRALAAEDVSEVLQEVERPKITFSDVYGADAAKGELEFIVNWLKDPRRYKPLGLRPPRGILLYGHPGTGKTMLARALAGECNVAFLVASAANFVTMWVGSGPKNVRDLFARARKYAPAIVFIDEIDAIGKKRMGGVGASASAEQTLNALLTEMDGFGSATARPVIVLAATNLVEHLDDALLRRFDREIEVDKPDRTARAAYLRKRLQGTELRCVSDEVVERLAGQSANMTIAELERVVELAGRMASVGARAITDEVMEEAFERMRMGETRFVTDTESLLRTARHEAGHCLIGWLRGDKPVQISIVARGKAGGFVESEVDESKTRYTRPDLEGMIRQALGGRAAEIIYYGTEHGLSTGASADLKAATHYAELMVRDYGMDDTLGNIFIDSRRLADGPLALRVMESAGRIIDLQLDEAKKLIENNREIVERLVDALMEKNRLTREELEAIMPRMPSVRSKIRESDDKGTREETPA